ncbi:hypothetical protein [Nocardioides sp. AX2bis]|uniref:hypothetical protein n=1 Tax=Nocardioides sp. AX2bis TaxID=2653157 RepID=UPI0012F02FEE|nr:hypothetical protein [Nocardioides sp. AX2bis]VXC39006.1 conserved hypothetical protein [Nocardioides sp. AX2bis]
MSDPAAARAWSWVAHLREGGRTPWTGWSAPAGASAGPAATGPRVLPGAQQLELLRRVNGAGDLPVAARDRVLLASALDRGRTDLPLPGGPRARFGPLPVDPAEVPADELLRVAVLLLADALPGAPVTRPEVAPPTRTSRLRRAAGRGYRVVGDPWLAARVREELRRRGRPPGGRRPRVLVLGGPVPDLLARTWAHRVLHEGAPAWPDWIAGQAGGALPRGADVAGQAEAWASRAGAGRVVVVTDPAALRRLVGLRRRDLARVLGPDAAGGLGGDAVELARRVRVALAVVAPPHEHAALLRERLLPALAALAGRPGTAALVAGPLPRVPAEQARWAARRAVRQRRRVLRAGYAVAGDVDDLLPGRPGVVPDPPGREVPDLEQVLEVAVSLLAQGLVPGRAADHGGEQV